MTEEQRQHFFDKAIPSWREHGISLIPARADLAKQPAMRQYDTDEAKRKENRGGLPYGNVGSGGGGSGSLFQVVVGMCRNGQAVSGIAAFYTEPA